MLILARTLGEKIRIRDKTTGRETWITIVGIDRGKVRVGFEAPTDIEIMREELIEEQNDNSSADTKPVNQNQLPGVSHSRTSGLTSH